MNNVKEFTCRSTTDMEKRIAGKFMWSPRTTYGQERKFVIKKIEKNR